MSGFAEGTPTVEIQLGGKSYTLGWTWGAKRRLKERLVVQGTDFSDVVGLSDQLPAAVWAGLDKDDREELTIEAIEEMIHPGNEAQIVEKLSSLFKASEPDPDPNASPAAVKMPTAGIEKSTSTNSSQSESMISV